MYVSDALRHVKIIQIVSGWSVYCDDQKENNGPFHINIKVCLSFIRSAVVTYTMICEHSLNSTISLL